MNSNIILAGDFVPRKDVAPYNPLSKEIKELFKSSGYVIINLESPLTDRGKPILKTGLNFRSDPQYARILKDSGVDCVCLANNHLRDYGDEGIEDTIRYCQEAGLDVVGAGMNSQEAASPLIKSIDGYSVAFLNYCEREFSIATEDRAGSNPYDDVQAYYDIQQLKKNTVGKIVVIYHGGLEYQHMPTLEMVKSFRYLVDIGADAVIAHHAHAYSGYELYQGKPIFYGLGNLLSYYSAKTPLEGWFTGLAINLNIIKDEVKGIIIPIRQDQEMQMVDILCDREKDMVLNHTKTLSENIKPDLLEKYWSNRFASESDNVLSAFLTPSRMLHRVSKKLRIRIPYINKYRNLAILNTIRCISHRERMISVLESKLKDNLEKSE